MKTFTIKLNESKLELKRLIEIYFVIHLRLNKRQYIHKSYKEMLKISWINQETLEEKSFLMLSLNLSFQHLLVIIKMLQLVELKDFFTYKNHYFMYTLESQQKKNMQP